MKLTTEHIFHTPKDETPLPLPETVQGWRAQHIDEGFGDTFHVDNPLWVEPGDGNQTNEHTEGYWIVRAVSENTPEVKPVIEAPTKE